MTYNINQPPFSVQFDEMSKKELRGYFDWYQSVMPQRIQELTNFVRSTPGFTEWASDYSPESLKPLGEWMVIKVEQRERTPDEIRKIQESQGARGVQFPIGVPHWELTNRTFSIALDVGMYVGETFRKNYASVHWMQDLANRKYMEYGHAVLAGFGPAVQFSPTQIMITLFYGMARKSKRGDRLFEIYEYWAQLITQRG